MIRARARMARLKTNLRFVQPSTTPRTLLMTMIVRIIINIPSFLHSLSTRL